MHSPFLIKHTKALFGLIMSIFSFVLKKAFVFLIITRLIGQNIRLFFDWSKTFYLRSKVTSLREL